MFDRILDNWFTSAPIYDSVRDVRIEEKEDEYVVKLDAAGISKEGIKISVDRDFLMVSGESSWKKINYKIKLPSPTVTENITAKTLDGILEISILKEKKKEEPKYIQVL